MCEPELSRSGRPPQRGFSLVEMLVAMVILSLSLGVLYQAAAGAIRNARVSGEYTEAVILAESKLAEYGYVTVENFSVQDRLGSFLWSVQSWPVPPLENNDDEEPVDEAYPLQFLRAEVSWGEGARVRELDLLTIVPLMELPDEP